MIMQKLPITESGLKTIEDDLRQLKTVERPWIIKAIADARAHGDLSENAEYHAAKERQGYIEARIKQLQGHISCAQVISPKSIKNSQIRFGATVTVIYDDDEHKYQIVGELEADVQSGKISYASPLSKSMIGKSVDDVISVNTPKGLRKYEIIKIEYI